MIRGCIVSIVKRYSSNIIRSDSLRFVEQFYLEMLPFIVTWKAARDAKQNKVRGGTRSRPDNVLLPLHS